MERSGSLVSPSGSDHGIICHTVCAVRSEDNGRVNQAVASLLSPTGLVYGTQGDMSLPASHMCRAEPRYYLPAPPPDDPIPPDEPILPEPDPEP